MGLMLSGCLCSICSRPGRGEHLPLQLPLYHWIVRTLGPGCVPHWGLCQCHRSQHARRQLHDEAITRGRQSAWGHGLEREPETLTRDNKVAVTRQVVQRYVHAGRRRPFDLIVVFGSPVQLCHAV